MNKEPEQEPFSIIEIIFSSLVEQSKTANENQEYFSIVCPIEHTIENKDIKYRLTVDSSIYEDINFKEMLQEATEYELTYYIDENAITFYTTKKNLTNKNKGLIKSPRNNI